MCYSGHFHLTSGPSTGMAVSSSACSHHVGSSTVLAFAGATTSTSLAYSAFLLSFAFRTFVAVDLVGESWRCPPLVKGSLSVACTCGPVVSFLGRFVGGAGGRSSGEFAKWTPFGCCFLLEIA